MTATYISCACRDCFDVAITANPSIPALCLPCEEAGCVPGNGECVREQWAEALEME